MPCFPLLARYQESGVQRRHVMACVAGGWLLACPVVALETLAERGRVPAMIMPSTSSVVTSPLSTVPTIRPFFIT